MSDRPNVLLFVFDTLRADALTCDEGAFSVKTPTFDGVAERGTTFENAFSVGPWTPPAHGAMFSGLYPSETGFDGAWPTMPESVPLLAEWFSDHGYRTYGIPGPAKMGSETGLDRGFEKYYEVYEEMAERPSVEYFKQLLTDPLVRDDFLRLLREGNDYYSEIKFDKLREWLGNSAGETDTQEPFFAMANVTTVHSPYDPPRPYKQESTPELSRPRIPIVEEFADSACSFDHPDVNEQRLFAAADGAGAQSIAMRYFDDPDSLSETEMDVLRTWYGASLRYLDDQLGAFFDWFDKAGLAEDTIVVLTSDHGEFFGEHDAMYHGNFLYDEVMRIPLIFSGPGIPEGEQRDGLASHIDLFETLCDCCDLPAPKTAGQSLFGEGERETVFAAEALSDLSDRDAAREVSSKTLREFEVGRKSVRTDEYRFEVRSDGTERLYELPSERVVADPPEQAVADLHARLAETVGVEFEQVSDEDAEYSDAVERNLRQLGYVE